MGKWTRRAFIGAGSLIGGGLVLGTGAIIFTPNRLGLPTGEQHHITTWLKLTPDNRITVLIPHADLGQGVSTALAMMAAEEMEADWVNIQVEEAPALEAFANGYMAQFFGIGEGVPGFLQNAVGFAMFKVAEHLPLQVTGGSSSVRATGELGMRLAGASARHVLIRAAATRWGVPDSECIAKRSIIHHPPTGRSLPFGAVADEAAHLTLPIEPALKPHQSWTLVGQPIPRLDLPPKTNGTTTYGIDVTLPGMLYATVRAAPIFGGKLSGVDPAPALARKGVSRVVKLDDAVAVIADSYWTALQAVRALKPAFTDAGHATTGSAQIHEAFAATLTADPGKPHHTKGDAQGALAQAPHVLEAEYSVPYQAHATMEPPNATARYANGLLEIWTGVQDPLGARKDAATAAGLPIEQVRLYNHPLGGGFGRKLPGAFDWIAQAARIAMAASPLPVKTIWSREEDISHDFYRQAAICRFKAGLDAQKQPIAWAAHYTGSADDGAAEFAYTIPNQRMAASQPASHIRLGYWRSVDHSQHGFFKESFLDELAAASGKDGFTFRRDLLPPGSRERAVLELAAEKANWGAPLPAGQARGIALTRAFGSIVAEVAEIEISPEGKLKIHRVTAAVDCGDLVNPDTARAQIEGGIMFGLSAALYGRISIANGAVQQSNFYDFRVAHMADSPAIGVHFIASHAPRGGMGEVGVPPIAAAVANAIYAATGRRLRTLPLAGQDLSTPTHAT